MKVEPMNHIPPDRVEEMITTAVRQGRRRQSFRRVASGTTALIAVAAMAFGAATLIDGTGLGPNPTEATPATTPNPSTPEQTSPKDTPVPTATSTPSPHVNVTDDFSTSYTEAEQRVILGQLSQVLAGAKSEDFTAFVTRTTRGDGLAALSPDDEISAVDHTPVFALRVSGPFDRRLTAHAGPEDSEPIELKLVGFYGLIAADGHTTGTGIYQRPDGVTRDLPFPPIGSGLGPRVAWKMPPIASDIENDMAVIDFQYVELPPLATDPTPPLSEEDQALADDLFRTFENLLPAGVEVTELLNSTRDGAVFNLSGAGGTTRGMIALWHLTPGADTCLGSEDCTSVPVDGGMLYIDTPNGSQDAPTRFYTYRRSDNAAIYFTMNIDPVENESTRNPLALPLTEDQMILLLTDPAWTPFLDRKTLEPPQ